MGASQWTGGHRVRSLNVTLNDAHPAVYRVATVEGLAAEWEPQLRFLVKTPDAESSVVVERWRASGLQNIAQVDGDGLEEGDVVACRPLQGKVSVLHRASDVHHTLFLTNRCNSYCLMCSQPPTPQDDRWLVGQAVDVVRHVRIPPKVVGISGGEPLLEAGGLRKVLSAIEEAWPDTTVEVLTNGRLLSNADVVSQVFDVPPKNVRWLVPLYGHADMLHDFVVQSPGAFDETIDGLLTLQALRQPIQLRIVLIQPVVDVLDELCRFIGQNLPFVEYVALMACEPTGFALANRELCELDLSDAAPMLERASRVLARYRVRHLFMNAPLCALPRTLWPLARRSISDWKSTYANECSECEVRENCCGLFAWHEKNWKPTRLKPIKGAIS
jgi:His-Xaa-Ser system radical SAM maturase HxsC